MGAVGIAIGAASSGVSGAFSGVFARSWFWSSSALSSSYWVLPQSNPQMAMTVALTIYLVKIGVLFVLIIAFADTTAFNTRVFAGTIVAGTLAWTVAEVWVFARTKVLYVDPEAGS